MIHYEKLHSLIEKGHSTRVSRNKEVWVVMIDAILYLRKVLNSNINSPVFKGESSKSLESAQNKALKDFKEFLELNKLKYKDE